MSTIEITTKIEALKELEALIEEAKAEAETLRDEIKTEMLNRDTEEMEAGQYIIRWTSVLSQRFDTTGFKKTHADLYNHSGMCVEYDLLEINKQLGFSPVPVIYSNDRASFNSIHEATIDADTTGGLIESLTSKSLEWGYEKEWRIIRDDGTCGDKWYSENKGALLDMIRPNSIILGCMVKPDYEKAVLEYCEANRINLYKMEKSKDQYRLEKVPVLQFEE